MSVERLPAATFYKPQGVPLRGLEDVTLAVEELEAMRLVDALGHSQEEAAERMGVSRPTICRILGRARSAVARALSSGMALRIEGGSHQVAQGAGMGRGGGRRMRRRYGRGDTDNE